YNTLQLKESSRWTYQTFGYSIERSRNSLDFLGIRYLFGPSKFSGVKLLSKDPVEVWENPSALAKWFCFTQAFPAADESAADMELSARKKIDLRKAGFLQGLSANETYSARKVVETRMSINELELSVRGTGKALLASTESNAPGWKVWVEGKPKPVETV